MFASVELARRIETSARRGLVVCASAVARRSAPVEPMIIEAAGGVAVVVEPGSPLNKVAGQGFDGPFDPADLDHIEAAFAARGLTVSFEISTLADPEVFEGLARHGYHLVGFENVLGLPLPDAPQPVADGLDIGTVGPGEDEAWCETMATGFSTPDGVGVAAHEQFPREPLLQAFADIAHTPLRRFLARRDGVIAGGATLDLRDGIAHLVGATTLPEHRRRGVQSSLLEHRLTLAAAEGCDLATLVALPGSTSHANAQRRGFALLYSRAILQRVEGLGSPQRASKAGPGSVPA